MKNISEKILNQLAISEVARNDPKKGYIEYLQLYKCENDVERAIIEKVLKKSISGASYKRVVAHIQNKLGLYLPNEEVKQKRTRQKQQMTIFYRITNWLWNITR